jgi:hypothetical protein
MIEIIITINDGNHQYYLLKIKRHDLEIFCFHPYLGMHFTLHKEGESHLKIEKEKTKIKESSVVLMAGEAGKPINSGIIVASLKDIKRASGICIAHFPINSLDLDFIKYNKKQKDCFDINKNLSSIKNAKGIEIGIWVVPQNNKSSFEFNNPDIDSNLLYKVACDEPQLWIYAKPSILFDQ